MKYESNRTLVAPPAYRAYFRGMLSQFDWEYRLVGSPNSDALNITSGARLTLHWAARVDRYLLGPKWLLRTDERMKFFAVPEFGRWEGRLHYHVLLRPPASNRGPFESVAASIFKGVAPRGSVKIDRVTDPVARQKVERYVLKDRWVQDCIIGLAEKDLQ